MTIFSFIKNLFFPRKVKVFKLVKVPNMANSFTKEFIGEAEFIGFGVDYEETTNSCGTFTAAIVKWPSGKVELIPANNIQFI